jgi:hypothetical protein
MKATEGEKQPVRKEKNKGAKFEGRKLQFERDGKGSPEPRREM